MAGLLAWAADVVAGNGSADDEEASSRNEASVVPSFHFSPEQQDYVRRLDAQAADLQRTIQHLRQRIPPPDISRSLPQLHTDSLAAHSALNLELNAHQATKKEAEIREESLHAENAAYVKAIASVQQQVRDKATERSQLEVSLQEMDQLEVNLRDELAQLQDAYLEKECAIQNEEKETDLSHVSNKAIQEEEELQRTRAELKSWEHKLSTLEQEWATLLQSSSRWPSTAQRERDLERKLRSVSEQLMTKQTQVDALINERKALEKQLNHTSEARRQHSRKSDFDMKTLKAGRHGLSSGGSTSASSKLHSEFANPAVWQRSILALIQSFTNVGSLSDILSNRQAGRSMMMVRASIVAYILSLHVIVFLVIAFSS